MLDEDASEALQRTEGSAVDHHGDVGLSICAGVGEIEAHGQDVIDLHGAELPLAAQHVLHDKVDLRAVERCLTRFLGVRDPE